MLCPPFTKQNHNFHVFNYGGYNLQNTSIL